MNKPELQKLVLRTLATDGVDRRLGRGSYYLADEIRRVGGLSSLLPQRVHEAVWGIVAQGLAYIDISQSAPENWVLNLTEAGMAVVRDEEYNPDDPSGYLSRLMKDVPQASGGALRYASEAVQSYNAQCYLASTVMQGVASEAAFLDLAVAFSGWLQGDEKKRFGKTFDNRRENIEVKFQEFRKRLEPRRHELPDDLRDGLRLWLDGVQDLLRVYRNDAGHPTGKTIARDDCHSNLRILARYLKKSYLLREFFMHSP